MLCKEFGWTPAQLDEVDARELEDFKVVMKYRREIEEAEQRAAERRAQHR